ncbi:TrmH family RNA methyltransferase [Luedemannella flava]
MQRRKDRDATGRFLAEGPQAVREALAAPKTVRELFATAEAADRYPELIAQAPTVSIVTDAAMASLAETVHPQGLVAVCEFLDLPLHDALRATPRLVVVLAGIADPGNAGTVLRTADAAGAAAVIFPDDTVDPYNGKCVRASAGSLFHVDVVRGGDTLTTVGLLRDAGLRVLAADAYGARDLEEYADDGGLSGRTAWVFGAEAHGLAPAVAEAAHARVKVPIHGRAESLNLAAAAAVCLYASARALSRE